MTEKKHNSQHLVVSPTAIRRNHHNRRRRRRYAISSPSSSHPSSHPSATDGKPQAAQTPQHSNSIARARRRRRSLRSRRRHTYRSLDRVLGLRKVPHVSRHGGDDTRVDVGVASRHTEAVRVVLLRRLVSTRNAKRNETKRNETNDESVSKEGRERRRGEI